MYAFGNLSRGRCSEWNAEVNTLIGPHFKEVNGGSRHTPWHIHSGLYSVIRV